MLVLTFSPSPNTFQNLFMSGLGKKKYVQLSLQCSP